MNNIDIQHTPHIPDTQEMRLVLRKYWLHGVATLLILAGIAETRFLLGDSNQATPAQTAAVRLEDAPEQGSNFFPADIQISK